MSGYSLDPLAPRGEGNGHVLQLRPLEQDRIWPCERKWLHSVPVSRSNMTSAFMMSLPETPKSRTWPFTSLEYPTPVKQRGHHVTAIGLPPTTSFTISCLLSNGTEYARASPSISTPSTSSSGPYSSPASSAETNEGLEIDGMASGGRSVTISYSRSGVGTGVGGGVLVAIGFAVFLSGVGVAVAVSGRGVCCPHCCPAARSSRSAQSPAFSAPGLPIRFPFAAWTHQASESPARSLRSAQPPALSCPGLPLRFLLAA